LPCRWFVGWRGGPSLEKKEAQQIKLSSASEHAAVCSTLFERNFRQRVGSLILCALPSIQTQTP
jgi:hypothetical protein